MKTRAIACVLGATIAAVAATIPARATPQQSATIPGQVPSARPQDGKETPAVIRGQVRLPNGRPAPGVQVRRWSDNSESQVWTDGSGRYEFTSVSPGSHRVSASKPGYVTVEYGQRRAFERGSPVSVVGGDVLERIDVTLPLGGVVVGRVVDEYGGPVEFVTVRLMEIEFGPAGRELRQVRGVGPRATDDLGRYRLYGVPPGRFLVVASTTEWTGTLANAANLPGYAPTYFPSAMLPGSAQPVSVGLSQTVSDIDVALVAVPTVTVAGTVTDAAGRPSRGQVRLLRANPAGGIQAIPLTPVTDGAFRILNVPPGDYIVQFGGERTSGGEGPWAAQPVSVNGVEVTGLQLQASNGSFVEGRFVFEGNAPLAVRRPGEPDFLVMVTTIPADDLAPVGGDPAETPMLTDGVFGLTGLSGPRRLSVRRTPPGWMLKAIRQNGRDITDTVLSFGTAPQSLTGLEVILTDRISAVSGTVADNGNQPVSEYAVIAFSTNTERWYRGSRFVRMSRAKNDGTFDISALPPDEYYVAAVDPIRGTTVYGEWQDPELLRAVASRATRITLGEGQQQRTLLRIITR